MKPSLFLRAILVCTLASNVAGFAPALAAPTKPTKPKAPIYALSLSSSGRGHGRDTDPGWTWVLHSNGIAERDGQKGTFNPADFDHLIRYLQSSKLLDQKSPPETQQAYDIMGETTVSLKRGSKTKSFVVSDLATPPESFWVINSLMKGIVDTIDWKNAQGLSVNTGLAGHFTVSDNCTNEEWNFINAASFDVKNDKGKVVGKLTRENEEFSYALLLPPGIYHVALPIKGQSVPEGTPSPAIPGNLVWHAFPASTFEVSAGQMMPFRISWQKKPATPESQLQMSR